MQCDFLRIFGKPFGHQRIARTVIPANRAQGGLTRLSFRRNGIQVRLILRRVGVLENTVAFMEDEVNGAAVKGHAGHLAELLIQLLLIALRRRFIERTRGIQIGQLIRRSARVGRYRIVLERSGQLMGGHFAHIACLHGLNMSQTILIGDHHRATAKIGRTGKAIGGNGLPGPVVQIIQTDLAVVCTETVDCQLAAALQGLSVLIQKLVGRANAGNAFQNMFALLVPDIQGQAGIPRSIIEPGGLIHIDLT